MSECSHNCENCSSNCSGHEIHPEFTAGNAGVKNVIGIVSGKGGVGKSLVTSLLASEMRKKNYNVSILDADITGPSIPEIFGVHEKIFSDGILINPLQTRTGIKIISMNLCLPEENAPVVWRGPVIAGAVKQFWEEVDWGETDYMFIDMPPGTGDVPLTVFQSLPVKGIIIVTTPQELVSMIVSKAVKMAELMNIPVLGLVENMSYFECPECKTKHYIFGSSHADETGIKIISRLPFNSKFAELCDAGKIEDFDAGNMLNEILQEIIKLS